MNYNVYLFVTEQVFVNALRNKEMKITDIDMLIMDECHHTDLGHPYNAIMAAYHDVQGNSRLLPQVVGLTASLGVGDNDDQPLLHYIRICANLNCKRITFVKANSPFMNDLLFHSPRPKLEQIISVEPSDPAVPFVRAITEFMERIELEKLHGIKPLVDRGTQPYENWIIEVSLLVKSCHSAYSDSCHYK